MFSRSRNSTARMTGDNVLLITSSLLDSVHEMEIFISVDLTSYKIIETNFEMKRAPYTFCFDMVGKAAKLNGFSVLEGNIGKRVNQLLSGKEGCLQLADLSLEAIKLVNQSIIGMLPGGRLEMLKTFDHKLQGTCYGHSHPLEEKIKGAFALVPGQLDRLEGKKDV